MVKSISQILMPGESIERKMPVSLLKEDTWIFKEDQHLSVKPVPLYKYANVNVTPESIVWRGLDIDKELLIHPPHTSMYNWKYCISNMIKRKRVNLPDGNYYLCTDYWAANYYHWMCDALPRVFMVKELLSEGILLLPGQYKAPYYLETLKAFDIKEIRIIPVKEYFNVPQLLVPAQPVICGQQYSELTRLLRKHLLAYFKKQFSGKHQYKNVYISRKKASYRWVLNENQVIEVLKKYGFTIICYEDYPLCEQIEIAYNAQNLISLHGANLTNLFYMQPNTNILEFRKPNAPPGSGNNSFWILADSIGVNYYYLNCEAIDRREGNYFDVTVNVNELEEMLKQMNVRRE